MTLEHLWVDFTEEQRLGIHNLTRDWKWMMCTVCELVKRPGIELLGSTTYIIKGHSTAVDPGCTPHIAHLAKAYQEKHAKT